MCQVKVSGYLLASLQESLRSILKLITALRINKNLCIYIQFGCCVMKKWEAVSSKAISNY
jgi:hypothetical protein